MYNTFMIIGTITDVYNVSADDEVKKIIEVEIDKSELPVKVEITGVFKDIENAYFTIGSSIGIKGRMSQLNDTIKLIGERIVWFSNKHDEELEV